MCDGYPVSSAAFSAECAFEVYFRGYIASNHSCRQLLETDI